MIARKTTIAIGLAILGGMVSFGVAHALIPPGNPPTNPAVVPSTPANLVVSGVTTSTISLVWSNSTDPNGALVSYIVYRGGLAVGTSTSATYVDSNLVSGTTYAYTVAAIDALGYASPMSLPVSATTQAGSSTASPTVTIIYPPTGATVSSTIIVVATSSDAASRITKVEFYFNGALTQTDTNAPYAWVWNTASLPSGNDTIFAKAYDAASNVGTSPSVPIVVYNPDTTPPSTPQNLSVTGSTSSTISLSWDPSDDNIGVAGYTVYRCRGVCSPMTSIATTTTSLFTDTNLASSTTYTYAVAAYDSSGKSSGLSSPAQGETQGSVVSYATITFVQSAGNYDYSPSDILSNLSVRFSDTNQAGDFFVVFARWGNSSQATVSDIMGNTFVPIGSQITSANSGASVGMWYTSNIKGGTNDVLTLQLGRRAARVSMHVVEYSGVDENSPIDSVTSSVDSATPISPSIGTHLPGELLFAGVTSDDGDVYHWSLNKPFWMLRHNPRIATGDAIVPPGTYVASFSAKGARSYVTELVAINPAQIAGQPRGKFPAGESQVDVTDTQTNPVSTSPTAMAVPSSNSNPGANVTSITSGNAEISSLTNEMQSLLTGLNQSLILTLTRNLGLGSMGADVKDLQIFLNNNGYPVASSGPGSVGNEGMYFGAATQAALQAWQAANGLPATGYLGLLSRQLLNAKR